MLANIPDLKDLVGAAKVGGEATAYDVLSLAVGRAIRECSKAGWDKFQLGVYVYDQEDIDGVERLSQELRGKGYDARRAEVFAKWEEIRPTYLVVSGWKHGKA